MNEDATSRLNSWKEIAAYLNRTARTAQRWERDEALPVHRHPHDKRDSVFAFPEELERWLASRKERLQYKAAADPDASAASKPLAIGGWPARGWLWPLAAGLAAVLIAAAAFIPWRDWLGLRPSLDFGPQNLVLTAEFQNQTGEPVFNDSLGTAFAVALQQSTHASLLPRARIEAALRRMGKDARTRIDERTGREICVRENVRALIAPQITEAGEKYALTARLIDPQTGIAVQAYYETAGGRDRVLDALGRLARRIRSGLGESLASIQRTDLPLPQVTTSSLQALRYYAEAQRAWSARQYERAQKLYAAAIEEDPEFAMAHAAYAGALFGPVWSDPVKGRKHYEIALGLADRVTEPERLRMRAMYHQYAGELEKAQEAYELYLQAYPDDATTHFNLGTMLMQHQHPEDAIPELKEAVRIAPNDANAWVNLAASELMSGDAGAAIPLYQRAFALEPSWPLKGSLNHEYGFALAAAGNLWKAEDLFEQALGQPAMRIPALRSLALLDMLQGKYTAAKAHLGEAIRMD